jgi:hypothetical protein
MTSERLASEEVNLFCEVASVCLCDLQWEPQRITGEKQITRASGDLHCCTVMCLFRIDLLPVPPFHTNRLCGNLGDDD